MKLIGQLRIVLADDVTPILTTYQSKVKKKKKKKEKNLKLRRDLFHRAMAR